MAISSARNGPSARTPRAAVVTGDPIPNEVLSGLLAEEGFDVLSFDSATAALTALTDKVVPDLIVADVRMPGIDGWRFCRLLRSPQYESFHRVPILAVSATFAGEETARISAELGANDFLALPVDEREFIQHVRQLLRGERPRCFARILIVDDDAALGQLLKESFIAHGYQADTAPTGHEAEAKFQANTYEVVVIDQHLPDLPGEQLLENLNQQSTNAVFLALTGDSRPELALAWMQRGAAAVVMKPFTPQHLIELCAKARREQDLLGIEHRLRIRTRELHQSEANLALAQEMARIGSWTVPLATMRGRLSPEASRNFGGDPSDPVLTSERVLSWIHAEDRPTIETWVEDGAASLQPPELEFRVVRPDGTVRHVCGRGDLSVEACDANPCLVGSEQDITERKEAEASRLEEHARFLGFAEASQYGMGIAELDGTITYVNPALARLLGEQSPQDCLGKHFPTAYYSDCVAHRLQVEVMPGLMRDGHWQGELEIRAVDGRRVSADVNAFIIRDELGKPRSVANIITDISEDKRKEDQLRRSEERYHSFVQQSHEAMYCTEFDEPIDTRLPVEEQIDAIYRHAYMGECNQAMAALYGLASPSELVGQRLIDFHGGADNPKNRATFRRFIESGYRTVESETEELTPGGERRYFRSNDFGIMKAGLLLRIWGTAIDITERKQTEEALRQSNQRFDRLAATVPVGIYTLRTSREAPIAFEYVNPKLTDILGVSAQALLSDPNTAFAPIHPDDRGSLVQLNQVRYRDLQPFAWEGRASLHGGLHWLRIESQPQQLADGTILWHGLLDDITERKRAEQALRLSEEKFAIAFASNPAGLALTRFEDGLFLDVNNTWVAITEFSRQEAIGNFARRLRIWPTAEAADRFLATLQEKGSLSGWEQEFLKKSGNVFVAQLSAELLTIRGEQVILSTLVDITDHKRTEQALRQSEEKLRRLVQNLQAGVVVHAPDTLILLANEHACRLLGLTLDQMMGKAAVDPAWRFVREDLSPLPVQEYPVNQVIATKAPLGQLVVGLNRPATNDQVWVQVNAFPEFDPRGSLVQVVVTFVDITERKQAMTELVQSEERWKFALEGAGDGIWDWDVPASTVFFSRRWKEMLGYVESDIGSGLDEWSKRVHPEDMPAVMSALKTHLDGHSAGYVNEHRVLCKDGGWKWILDRGMVIRRDTEGKPLRVIGTHCDITERKQAEVALERTSNMLAEAQKIAHLGCFEYVAATQRTVWSDEEYRIYGLNPDGPSPTYDYMLQSCIHPGDAALLHETFMKAMQSCSVYELEHRIVRPDGSERWVYDRANPHFDENGNLLRYVGVTLDITERKQAEVEREKLQGQLAQAQKMESVGRLAGGVAHDFNNMLGAILGNVNLALRDAPPGSLLRENLEEIEKCANRSADLTRQLLAFARKQTVVPQVVDLNVVIVGMLKMLRRLIGEDIDLTWLPAVDLWTIKLDPSQIDQILANLCVNARDAIAGVGNVTLVTANVAVDETYTAEHAGFAPGDYVLLSVSDTGCGMDKATQSHLFEPFFTTKGIGQGTGLGLATVYGIVRQNAGHISVYSEPAKGTTFKIYLPRHLTKVVPSQAIGAQPAASRGNETILLVEDEPSLLRISRRALEGLGYTVVAASAPGEAIQLAEKHSGQVHLLVTDVVMPEMNGRDLAKRLLSLYPNLKHLFISGYTADVIAHHGVLDAGIHFLQKPFTVETLASKVREALVE